MGQRLNIEIADNGKVLANAYYHWDAYTKTAAQTTERIVKDFYNLYGWWLRDLETRRQLHEPPNKLDMAARLLWMTGAGVNMIEHNRMLERNLDIGIPPSLDRNAGLISITEEGMKETRDWEEGRVTIDIGEQKVYFGVYIRYNTEEEFREDYEETDYVTQILAQKSSYDISDPIPFRDVYHCRLTQFVYINSPGYSCTGPDGGVYIWIE